MYSTSQKRNLHHMMWGVWLLKMALCPKTQKNKGLRGHNLTPLGGCIYYLYFIYVVFLAFVSIQIYRRCINFLSTLYQLFINFFTNFINFLSTLYQLFINVVSTLSTVYQLSKLVSQYLVVHSLVEEAPGIADLL